MFFFFNMMHLYLPALKIDIEMEEIIPVAMLTAHKTHFFYRFVTISILKCDSSFLDER